MPRYGAPEIPPALVPLRGNEVAAIKGEANTVFVELRAYLRSLPRMWVREPFTYRQGETVRVEIGLHRPPAGLLVIRALQSDAPATAPSCSAVPSWTWHQETGTVALSSIGGLTTGTDYLVTLLVVE